MKQTNSASTLGLVFCLWLCAIIGCSAPSSNLATNNSTASTNNSSPFKPSPSNSNPPLLPRTTPTAAPTAAPEPGIDQSDLEDSSDLAVVNNIKAADKSITYEHLKKNADKYNGQAWSFTGKILEIQELEGKTVARIGTGSWGSKPVLVTAPFTTDFVEDNNVFIVGYLTGSYSYESQAGWNITIPSLTARAILKPADAAKLKVSSNKKGK